MSATTARAELAVSRRTIATVTSYEEAERAVDRLFPVEHVTIVGTGLRYLEQVEGRTTLLGAAGAIVLGGCSGPSSRSTAPTSSACGCTGCSSASCSARGSD
jgi:hypothetical protein